MNSNEMDKAARQVMDTGVLNPYMKAYFRAAMRRAGIDEDTQDNIMNQLREVLDLYTAAEIMEQANDYIKKYV